MLGSLRPERRLSAIRHRLCRRSRLTSAEEDLRADDILVARPIQLLERLTHLDFALAIGIDLGSID